jgi:hypothetical protein
MGGGGDKESQLLTCSGRSSRCAGGGGGGGDLGGRGGSGATRDGGSRGGGSRTGASLGQEDAAADAGSRGGSGLAAGGRAAGAARATGGLGRGRARGRVEGTGLDAGVRVDLDRVAGVGDDNVLVVAVAKVGGAAAHAGDVGDEEVGQLVIVGLVSAGAGEREFAAVHVELAVADTVDPGPGDGGVSGRDIAGDGVVVGEGVGGGSIVSDVAGGVASRAATLDGVDDLPDARLGGLSVVGDGELARATTVDGRAHQGQRLLRAEGERVYGTVPAAGDVSAGEIASGLGQGAVDGRVGLTGVASAVRVGGERHGLGALHVHVAIGHRKESGGSNDLCVVVHLGGCFC